VAQRAARAGLLAIALAIALTVGGHACAWVYPEHRDIAVLAVQGLDTERSAELERMWSAARAGHDERLCAQPALPVLEAKPVCLDWAAWPAIAGDHSCSAENMLDTVLDSKWVLKVAGITEKLKQCLASAKNQSRAVNCMRDSDIELQRADPEYATRAGSNNAHFMLARPRVDTDGESYVKRCLGAGNEINAVGIYAWYHYGALVLAARMSREGVTEQQRSALSLAALANEAFALHFLEDSFAAGHVAGTWGDVSVRKGTHDYYNEQGLETVTWDGKPIIVKGDAYMRPEDAERAAMAVRTSIAQLVDAAGGKPPVLQDDTVHSEAAAFDVCTTNTTPTHQIDRAVIPLWVDVLKHVPVPALAEGTGALPRFRAELGPFIGVSTAVFAAGIDGGFDQSQTTAGGVAGLDLQARLGMGLEGVMNEAGDGLVFLELGFREDSASTIDFTSSQTLSDAGAIVAAIPARSAYTARLRMPFWLVPGDLILGLPVMIFSKRAYAQMAVTASNGGLIPWQLGIATPAGRFQFVLGREVGVSFYGYGHEENRYLMPTGPPGSSTVALVAAKSVAWEFPVVEYRPFRSFSMNQSSSLVVQLYGGFDQLHGASILEPVGAPPPEFRTVYEAGLRVVFDWRHY
jgi:hypothetical protein